MLFFVATEWHLAQAFKCQQLSLSEASVRIYKNILAKKLAYYVPRDYIDRYIHMAYFIDIIDVNFPFNKFFREPFNLDTWAIKYILCSKIGDGQDLTRNMLYLDFCYNELVLNKLGIYKKKSFGDYEFYMSYEDYENTFYKRVSNLKNSLFLELFGINFDKISKTRMQEVLNLEMDFFWYIEKK